MSYISEAPTGAAADLRYSARMLFHKNVGLITAIIDCFLIVTASIGVDVGYHFLAVGHVGDVQGFAGISSIAALLFVLPAKSLGLYRPAALLSAQQLRGVVMAWAAVLLAVVSLLFLLKLGDNYFRGATVGLGGLGLVLLLGSRDVIADRLRDAAAPFSLVNGALSSTARSSPASNCERMQ